MPGTAGAEDISGHNSNLLPFEQLHGKSLRRKPARSNIRKHVKSPLRIRAWKTDFVETADDVVAAAGVFNTHLADLVFTVFDGFNRGILGNRRCTQRSILVNFENSGNHLFRTGA